MDQNPPETAPVTNPDTLPIDQPSPGDQIRGRLAALPPVTEREWRLACNDIVEGLSKHLGFRVRIIVPLFAILLAIVAIVGWNTSKGIKERTDEILALADTKITAVGKEAEAKIGDAKTKIDDQIKEALKTENIQRTIQSSVTDQSRVLLKDSVQPSIERFDSDLKKIKEEANEKTASIDSELARLKKRNDLTALADRAITQGDVKAYRQLEKMATASPDDGEDTNANVAELFRVFSAYSLFAPTRGQSVIVNVAQINPQKTKEDELDYDELIGIWEGAKGIGRAKIALLLQKKTKLNSFSQAEWVIAQLEQDNHLETIMRLNSLFMKITGYDKGGKLDGSDILAWWKEHKEEVRTKDTDKPAEPTK